MRTSNPIFNDKIYRQGAFGAQETMTIQGTVNKTGILLMLLFVSATWIWGQFFQNPIGFNPAPYIMGGVIGGLVVALITFFKKEWSMFTSPIYALLEGLALGGISAQFEMQFPGMVLQAVALTFGILFALLMIYKTGLITVTDKFRKGVFAATGGIFLVYLISFVMSFFGMPMPYLHEGGMIGIGLSLFIIVVASLNLVLDFDFIEKGSQMGAPKYMEWFSAFGLLVTLVWLYIEVLRLLSKINRR